MIAGIGGLAFGLPTIDVKRRKPVEGRSVAVFICYLMKVLLLPKEIPWRFMM